MSPTESSSCRAGASWATARRRVADTWAHHVYLVALDAASGEPVPGFGNAGAVNLADDPDPQDPRDPVVTTPTPESPQEGLRSSSSATGRSLPSTGSDVTFTTLLIATVLVVLGGSALAVRRRARA